MRCNQTPMGVMDHHFGLLQDLHLKSETTSVLAHRSVFNLCLTLEYRTSTQSVFLSSNGDMQAVPNHRFTEVDTSQ